MTDSPGPGLGRLLDWLEQRLPLVESDLVERQVSTGDPQVRETVEWLRGFVEHARGHRLHRPPASVRAGLAWAFAEQSPVAAPAAARRVAEMALIFDSRDDLAVGGVRAAATSGDVIHLAYGAEEADLVLDVSVGPTGLLTVAGQVLPQGDAPPEDYWLSLNSGETGAATARGDAAGRFRLPGVRAPLTRFTATSGPVTFDIDLDLGHPFT